MTSTDTTTSWRELAGNLTAEQVAEVEGYEAELRMTDPRVGVILLNIARRLAACNEASRIYAHVPAPADAVGEVDQWEQWDEHIFARSFVGTGRVVTNNCISSEPATARVEIRGTQYADGRVERVIHTTGDGIGTLDAAAAREVAAALLAAADELSILGGAR